MALINLRNALMTGRRLPYDAEIEYIESTGTQWINTGVICDQGTDIIFSGRTRTVTTATMFFFGARTAFTQNAFTACLTWNVGQNQMLTQVGFGSFNGQNYLPSIPSNSDFVISNSGTTWSLTVGGQTTQITAATSAFTTPTTALLFRMSNNGTPDSRSFNGAIYSVKLYQNGVLVRDFIPVRKGTVGYLYDRVSGKLFGNDGTGDFVVGPDVVPVEYIESHGTEWIDTGVTFTTATVADISLIATPTSIPTRDAFFYGLQNLSLGNIALETYNGQIWLAAGQKEQNAGTASAGTTYNFSAHYESGNSWLKINGSTAATIANSFSQISPRSLWLFARNNGTNIHPCLARMEEFAVSLNGTSACNYHPVRVGTDATSWEGAMMDVLTRRIYRNAGTGAFTYGNDLKYPIPAA